MSYETLWIAVDAISASRNAIGRSVALAQRLGGAETALRGVVIEDSDWQRLNTLSLASQVRFSSARVEYLHSDSLLVQTDSAYLEDSFHFVARMRRAPIQVSRASVEALQTGEQDLLVVPQCGVSWVGRPWQRRRTSFNCDVLFLNEPWSSGVSIVLALHKGMPPTDIERCLSAASAMAQQEGIPVHVVKEAGVQLGSERTRSDGIVAEGMMHNVDQLNADTLRAVCEQFAARVLVGPASLFTQSDGLSWSEWLSETTEMLECSVYLLKPAS